jgi:hypothetical protein
MISVKYLMPNAEPRPRRWLGGMAEPKLSSLGALRRSSLGEATPAVTQDRVGHRVRSFTASRSEDGESASGVSARRSRSPRSDRSASIATTPSSSCAVVIVMGTGASPRTSSKRNVWTRWNGFSVTTRPRRDDHWGHGRQQGGRPRSASPSPRSDCAHCRSSCRCPRPPLADQGE